MKSDLAIALRTRWVQSILLSSFILRVFFNNFFLPEKPSAFAPDEGTYALLSGYVADGKPVQEFPGFGPDLYYSSRSLIVPSSILIRLGVSELESVRVISSFYGLLSTLLVILCLITIMQNRSSRLSFKDYGLRVLLPVTIFTFFPSNFLWSTLGLRESSSQFWLISACYFLLKLGYGTGRASIGYFLSASLSIVFSFGARKETALLATLCALMMSLYVVIKKRNLAIFSAISLGIFGGQMFISTPQVTVTEVFYLIPSKVTDSKSPTPTQSLESKSPTPTQSLESKSPTPTQSLESKSPSSPAKARAEQCRKDQQRVKTQQGDFTCNLRLEHIKEVVNPIQSTKNQILAVKVLEETRKVRSIDAESALPESQCKTYSSPMQTAIFCNVRELPFQLTSFLLRPFPLIDSGSSFYNIASLENIIWFLLYLIFVYQLFTTRVNKAEKFIVLGVTFFIVSFSTLASLYEGNLGTAFRHKSSILWTLIVSISILFCSQRTYSESDTKVFQMARTKKLST
jgi:hypothetical protein